MADKVQFRRDTAARWASVNPILLDGEIGYITDSQNQYKMGDGVHPWNDLPLQGFNGNIVDVPGTNTDSVMSQKGATDLVSEYNVSANNNNAEYTFAQAVALVPVSLQKGGMSIKFVQSSDNKYVQYFLTKNTWSVDENDWQKMNVEEEVENLEMKVNGIDEEITIPSVADYYVNRNTYIGASTASSIVAIYVKKGAVISAKGIGGDVAAISKSLISLAEKTNAEIASLLSGSQNLVVLANNPSGSADTTTTYQYVADTSSWYLICGLVGSFEGSVKYEGLISDVEELKSADEEIKESIANDEFAMNGEPFRVITENLVKDEWVTHQFSTPIEKGSVIRKVGLKDTSYAVGSCYLVNESGNVDININTISTPYTTTKKYIGYKANINGSLMLFIGGNLGAITSRKVINILSQDSIATVVDKMWFAALSQNVDVIFEKSTYTIDDIAIEYIVKNYSQPSRIGLPLGKGCRYYLNGSTIIVNQTERYSGNKEVSCFDNQEKTVFGWEIHNGILINNNSKYCIHDETEGASVPYTNKIVNVRMYAKNDAQCTYGCGTGYNTKIVFENCIFCNDGTAHSPSNMIFHGPSNPTGAIDFDLEFYGCYFDNNTTISVGTNTFDTSRDKLVLVCANSAYGNAIPSYVLELFNEKYIYENN